ncbi:Spliceosome-associated protein 49 [Coemansia sp. RSA 454]|nr:Spliceosome-associated protein 49 [Coemansia sp. RSA 454]
MIRAIIVGADRVAANGDTANKIGTYQLAITARYHGCQFIVAAPTTSVDLHTKSGADIVIEERDEAEILVQTGFERQGVLEGRLKRVEVQVAPVGTRAWNPSFDVTPAELISAIVTERGIVNRGSSERMAQKYERNQDASIYVGNLDDRVTDELLWELMVQAGPVVGVHLPKDRVTQSTQGYGFVEFQTEADAQYAVQVMNMVKLFGKPMRINMSAQDRRTQDIGAKLFIGNLDPTIDDKLLYDTFGTFGPMVQMPHCARDQVSGNARGFAFVSYASFEAADAAIQAMDGQYLANKQINVQYAFKKDAKGERHGSAAERLLAAQAQKNDRTL